MEDEGIANGRCYNKIIMEILRQIVRRKPIIFVIYSLVYLVFVGLGIWLVSPSWDSVWFVGGGLVGIYLLDIAEIFFALSPSPFRSIVFLALFVVVGFFVVSSGGSAFASGLVLSLYLQLLFWQIGQWRLQGSLDSWYRLVAGTVSASTQRVILIGFGLLFCMLTYIGVYV